MKKKVVKENKKSKREPDSKSWKQLHRKACESSRRRKKHDPPELALPAAAAAACAARSPLGLQIQSNDTGGDDGTGLASDDDGQAPAPHEEEEEGRPGSAHGKGPKAESRRGPDPQTPEALPAPVRVWAQMWVCCHCDWLGRTREPGRSAG